MTAQMVRAVLTLSGTWKHYALIDAPRTVCGAKVSTPANPGQASCHRCMRWANQRRILVQDTDGETFDVS